MNVALFHINVLPPWMKEDEMKEAMDAAPQKPAHIRSVCTTTSTTLPANPKSEFHVIVPCACQHIFKV